MARPQRDHRRAFTATGRPPHFAFGGGIHYCLGHLVARSDMSVALPLLARRLREPHVSGEAIWRPNSGNTGPARLPIAFTGCMSSAEPSRTGLSSLAGIGLS